MKPQKILPLLLILALALLTQLALAQQADQLIGQWKDASHPEKQVEFYRQGNELVGKSINTSGKPGKIIFKALVWHGEKKTWHGMLINPDNDQEFAVDIALTNANTFRFKVGKLIFTQTFTFNRILP